MCQIRVGSTCPRCRRRNGQAGPIENGTCEAFRWLYPQGPPPGVKHCPVISQYRDTSLCASCRAKGDSTQEWDDNRPRSRLRRWSDSVWTSLTGRDRDEKTRSPFRLPRSHSSQSKRSRLASEGKSSRSGSKVGQAPPQQRQDPVRHAAERWPQKEHPHRAGTGSLPEDARHPRITGTAPRLGSPGPASRLPGRGPARHTPPPPPLPRKDSRYLPRPPERRQTRSPEAKLRRHPSAMPPPLQVPKRIFLPASMETKQPRPQRPAAKAPLAEWEAAFERGARRENFHTKESGQFTAQGGSGKHRPFPH